MISKVEPINDTCEITISLMIMSSSDSKTKTFSELHIFANFVTLNLILITLNDVLAHFRKKPASQTLFLFP